MPLTVSLMLGFSLAQNAGQRERMGGRYLGLLLVPPDYSCTKIRVRYSSGCHLIRSIPPIPKMKYGQCFIERYSESDADWLRTCARMQLTPSTQASQ